MARIIGRSFREPFVVRPREESVYDRQLASFISPQGVMLAARGIQALGGLPNPFAGDGGGLEQDKLKQAASKRAAAVSQLKDTTTQLFDARKALVKDSDLNVPIEVSAQAARRPSAAGQETYYDPDADETKTRTVKRFDEGTTTPESNRLRKLYVTDPEAFLKETGADTPSSFKSGAEQFALEDVDQIDAVDITKLSDGDLIALSDKTVQLKESFRPAARSYMGRQMGAFADPAAAMKQINTAKDRVQTLSNKVADELKRRTMGEQMREVRAPAVERGEGEPIYREDSPLDRRIKEATKSVEEYGKDVAAEDPIYGMDASGQAAEIRRLAKAAKTVADKDRVRKLTAAYVPKAETLGDLFTTQSQRRKAFEKEINDLIPEVDLVQQAQLEKLRLETEIAKRDEARAIAKEKRAEVEAVAKAAQQVIENRIAGRKASAAETASTAALLRAGAAVQKALKPGGKKAKDNIANVARGEYILALPFLPDNKREAVSDAFFEISGDGVVTVAEWRQFRKRFPEYRTAVTNANSTLKKTKVAAASVAPVREAAARTRLGKEQEEAIGNALEKLKDKVNRNEQLPMPEQEVLRALTPESQGVLFKRIAEINNKRAQGGL